MLDSARDAMVFMRGRGRKDLEQDRQLLLAVVKAIEIIGEAARHVSDPTRSRLPSLPWPQIVGMRHRIVHIYFKIDPELVWHTVVDDLPPLVAALEAFLAAPGQAGY